MLGQKNTEPIRYDKSAECKTGCDLVECDILLAPLYALVEIDREL